MEARDAAHLRPIGEADVASGALDQDFYPETIYSTPGKPYLVDMMKKGRALGLNLLRCHIKVCDRDYLEEQGLIACCEGTHCGRNAFGENVCVP